MTYREAMECCRSRLREAGISDDQTDAWLLLAYAAQMDRTHYYMHMDEEMPEEEQTQYRLLYTKRMERIPLQYILGEQEFMGLRFRVNSHVLIPRQDTETLVEEALRRLTPGMKVMDLCTGSGCVIISIAKNYKRIEAYGYDISKQALATAKENARLNDVPVIFEWSNLFENVTEQFDMIVCNPPYIPSGLIPKLAPEVAEFEPKEALDGGENGLDYYRKIISESPQYLNPGGQLLFEIGYDQALAVTGMMERAGYQDVACIQDLAGHDRVVCGYRQEV